MAKSGRKGFARMLKASEYSWQGLRAAWRYEAAFREEALLLVLLVPLGLYLGDGGVEKALLVATALLLPLVEILNSAIEAVVDRLGDGSPRQPAQPGAEGQVLVHGQLRVDRRTLGQIAELPLRAQWLPCQIDTSDGNPSGGRGQIAGEDA